jgi:hypothetical protein
MTTQLKCEADAARMSKKTPDEIVLVCNSWIDGCYVILESAYTGEESFILVKYLNGVRLDD